MPVQQVKENGKPGFRWGDEGKVYHYVAGDRRSVKLARKKAEKQGAAIEAKGSE